MKKCIFVIIALFITFFSHGSYAQSFRGNHKVSLQWISWDSLGQIRTTGQNGDGSFPISGGQSSKTTGDYLRIEGVANQIEPNVVYFQGVIVTKISHINGGEPCTRRGNFEFKRTQGRKYWRLQQMDNPCDGVTDYVDIYF
jgi:hypothetical protein